MCGREPSDAYACASLGSASERSIPSRPHIESSRVESRHVHLSLLNPCLEASGELPLLLFLPADDKQQPFTYYSGVAKVQPMMRWVAETAHIKFHLPDLCHLTPEDRDIYKIQVTEREVQRKADLAADLAEQLAEQARQDQYAQEQERGDDQAEDASADADGADCAADGTQAHAGKMEL